MTGALLAGVSGALLVVGVILALPRPAELPLPLRGLVAHSIEELRRSAFTLRRLRLSSAVGGAVAGGVLFGMRGALLFAVAAAWLAPRALAVRRRRRGRRLDEGAAPAARAIADAMSAGASLRRSVAVAAHRVSGPMAEELGRTAWELEMGAGTEPSLERLRARSGSQAVALIVAALQVHRRSGGDLARVLRGVATALEQDRQVIEEADAATAQARFTAIVVVVLPVCGIGLGALAAPDLPARMVGSAVGAGLLIAALALQLGGVLMVRRLARSWR